MVSQVQKIVLLILMVTVFCACDHRFGNRNSNRIDPNLCPTGMSRMPKGHCMDDKNRWTEWWAGMSPLAICSRIGGYVCRPGVDYECANALHSALKLAHGLGCKQGVGGSAPDYYDNGDFVDGDSFRCCYK